MRKLKNIYVLLIASLLGFAISSCDKDDVTGMGDDSSNDGTFVTTSFSVGVSAPDVSMDVETATRAADSDNANIEYAQPENGGRFQNVVIVLTDHNGKIYGTHCNKWYDDDPNSVGVKEYIWVFPNIQVPSTDVTNKRQYKVYAFGNVCKEHFKDIEAEATTKVNSSINNWENLQNYCISLKLSADDIYKLNFKPGKIHYSKKNNKEYYVNKSNENGGVEKVVCTGMPENNSVDATVVRGNTQFNVPLKRVCARLQVTFRNYTGFTNYEGESAKGNRIYIDQFSIWSFLGKQTNYFVNGTKVNGGTENFDILKVWGCKDQWGNIASDHVNNMIENGESTTVSMYVFEGASYPTYNLKVDRGKSLGNRAGSLQDGNVYVMWNDNLDSDSKDWKNTKKVCLGANSSNEITLQEMNDAQSIPYGTGDYGNRVFWKYTGKKFENCEINLATDLCKGTNYFIKSHSIWGTQEFKNREYPLDLVNGANNAQTFDEVNGDNFTPARKRLKITSGISHYLQVSKDKLYDRYISSIIGDNDNNESAYPWVFFAKYIIRNSAGLNSGTPGNTERIKSVDRNGSYELDFSVMPNYDDKEELLVKCVRKQNEIEWEEVQK